MKRRLLSRYRRFYKNLWLRGVFPQIEIYRERERAIAEAAFDEVWFTQWYPWYLVLILVIPCSAAYALLPLAGGLVHAPLLAAAILVVGLPATVAVTIALDILFMFLIRPLLQRYVRIALRRKGYDVCMECGYLMFGVSPGTMRCPECGAQRPAAPSA